MTDAPGVVSLDGGVDMQRHFRFGQRAEAARDDERAEAADLRDAVQDLRELDADSRERAADLREQELDQRDRAEGGAAPGRSAERNAIMRRHGAVTRARAAGERDRSSRECNDESKD